MDDQIRAMQSKKLSIDSAPAPSRASEVEHADTGDNGDVFMQDSPSVPKKKVKAPAKSRKRPSLSPEKQGSSEKRRSSGRMPAGQLTPAATLPPMAAPTTVAPIALASRPNTSANDKMILPTVGHLKALRAGNVLELSMVLSPGEKDRVVTSSMAFIDAWVKKEPSKAARWLAGERWSDVCMRALLVTSKGTTSWHGNDKGQDDMKRACKSCPRTTKGPTGKHEENPCIRRWYDATAEEKCFLVLLPNEEGSYTYWL